MTAGIWLETFFAPEQLNSFSVGNPCRAGRRRRESSAADGSRDSPAPPRRPRRRFGAHSGGEPRAPPTPASPDPSPARSPPPRAEKPRWSGTVSAPSSRRTPRPALPARRLTWRPKGTAPPTKGRSAKIGKVSESRPAGSQQPSSRSKINPASLPGRGKERCWKPRAEDQEHSPPGPRASGGLARPGPERGQARGAAGANPARGKGRRRADPLARVCCSAPRLPRLRRHQGRLWKQTWASPPALARSRYLSRSRFPAWFILLIAGEKAEAEAGAEEGWRRWGGGGGGCRNGGMAGGETCGSERLRLASPGKSEGGGWGWAAGGLGVRAVGRRRARSSPPYKAERNSQSRRRLAPAARREAGERTQPRGAPGGQPAAQRASTGCRAPAEYRARVFGGYFCTSRQRPPSPSPGRRIHRLPRNRGEVMWQQM